MYLNRQWQPLLAWSARALWVTVVALGAFACGGGDHHGMSSAFQQSNLISNSGQAPVTDPNLLNPWGIARSPTGPWWVSDNHAGVSTVYDGQGHPFPTPGALVVTIPPPAGSPPGTTAAPTGIVFNSNPTGFIVTEGAASGPALFIFATEDGTISGWSQKVNPSQAILMVDNSAGEAIYKGLAGSDPTGNDMFVFASDFHNGKVDVFDSTFTSVDMGSSAFSDPNIPAGFAPFGIRNIGGQLFVTYAKQDADAHDDVKGLGNGYVDVFTTSGVLVRRFASQGPLNSPWGVVQTPASFGGFGNAIIIGNFGDGHLSAFDPVSGSFKGQLNQPGGMPVAIDGLWALEFGNGGTAGSTDTLFFSAGPNAENDGLFGMLTATAG